MSDGTKIEWTDASWNVINGCTVVSPGCTNCYAMRLAGTRLKHIDSRKGLTQDSKAGPVWTGEVRLHEPALLEPLRWKRPRRIFVCAHGDLFHEAVPDAWIDRVFAVMALAPQHVFQLLSKRADRMRAYLSDPNTVRRVYDTVCDMVIDGDLKVILIAAGSDPEWSPPGAHVYLGQWPLPNVWLGVSVEDQTRADERIPILLDTPAAVRWISAEPLLGMVDLIRIDPGDLGRYDVLGKWPANYRGHPSGNRLDWIVVGGESGSGARPMKEEWARLIVLQCRDAGVSVFVKQLSGPNSRAIHDIEQFPADLRIREYPK